MAGSNIKHIFSDLKPDGRESLGGPMETEEANEDLLRGSSLKDTKATVLKRMILEILPHLGDWLQDNYQGDPQALAVLDAVRKEKGQYKHVNESGWNQFLEDLTHLRPEVHIWKTPPESSLWLADPKKNPFLKRAKELIEAEDEDTLLIGWNQYCGVIACEILQGEPPLEKAVKGFPTIKTKVFSKLYAAEERQDSPYPKAELKVWAWDKRNFEQKI